MDRTTQLQKILEVMGFSDLKALKLGDLENKVKSIEVEALENKYILPTYFAWLDERLVDQDLSDESNTAAEISAWCKSLYRGGFGKEAVLEAFEFWRSLQIKTDPLSARRLQLAELDIRARFPSPSAAPVPALEGSPTNEPKNEQPEVIVISDNSSPLGASAAQEQVAAVSSPTVVHEGTCIKDNQETVSNEDNTATKATKKPPAKYKCKRCKIPGHFLKDCPTSMDPSYDIKPKHGHSCGICGVYGEHFDSVCPENTNYHSLTQRRLRHARGERDGVDGMSSSKAEPLSSARSKKQLRRLSRQDLAGLKSPTNDDDVVFAQDEEKLAHRTKRKAVSLDLGMGNMNDYIHESRLGNFQGSSESNDYSGSHRDLSPTGRAAKRHRPEHWGQTANHGIARDRDLLDQATNRRSIQRAAEGRLSYWDDKESRDAVLAAGEDYPGIPFSMGDSELQKSAGGTDVTAPSFGWRHAEELGYSRRYEEDGPKFLADLAESFKSDGADHDYVKAVVEKEKHVEDTETTAREVIEGSEQALEGIVSIVNKHGETINYDFSKMRPEKAADPLAIVKLFKNKAGILSPQRPDLKRPTAMEIWDRLDGLETHEQDELVGQTANAADTMLDQQQKKQLEEENNKDSEKIETKTTTDSTAAVTDADAPLSIKNESTEGGS